MIPIGPLVWIAIRLASANNRNSAPAQSIKVPTYVGVWLGILAFLAVSAVFLGVSEARIPSPELVVFSPLAIFLTPWLIVRFVFIPLGWPWPAFVLARLAYYVFRHANETGAAFAAALALSRARRHSAKMEARIVRRVTRRDVYRSTSMDATLDGTGVAALGFVAVSRSERDSARSLLRCVLDFPMATTPPVVLEACMDWLAADAFDRGDDDFLEELARNNPRAPVRIFRAIARLWRRIELPVWTRIGLPPAARLFVSLARHRRHGPRPFGSLAIWLRVARCGRPVLVPVACHALKSAANAPQKAVRMRDALRTALNAHADAVSAPASLRTGDRLKELCHRWDRALREPDVTRRVLARELDLGVSSEETVVDRLRAAAIEDVARLALEAGAPLLEGPGDFLEQVAGRMRTEALHSLETVVAARAARIEQRGPADCESELRDYLLVREAYDGAARLGSEPRCVAFSIALPSIWNHACTLFNQRAQRPFAHAQFRWLVREAEATGHTRVLEPLRKNVRIAV